MTPELVGILSVGAALLVGLGGLMLALWRDLRGELRRLEARIERLEGRVNDLDRRLARVEGVIEGMAYANGRARPDREHGEERAA